MIFTQNLHYKGLFFFNGIITALNSLSLNKYQKTSKKIVTWTNFSTRRITFIFNASGQTDK